MSLDSTSDARRDIIDQILQLSASGHAAEEKLRSAYERYDLDDLKAHLQQLQAGRAAGKDDPRASHGDGEAQGRRVGLVERMEQVNKPREAPRSAAAAMATGAPKEQLETRSIQGKPTVIIVGADKGGVGKTTVSRALLDYFGARNVPIRAFDTESPKGTLKRFHPQVTDVVDVTAVPDQMRIFDTLATSGAAVTVIDVRAGLLSTTLQALRDIGFLELARRGQITLALFHIVGPSIASLDEIAGIAPFVADGKYYVVKNFINNTSFFEWDRATHDSYFKQIRDAVDITIPKLNEMACEQVELSAVPFVTFVANKNASGEPASYSFVLRGYVRHWLGNVWAEFDRVQLPEIVTPRAGARR